MESITFWGFSIHAWITIVTMLATFGTLLFTKLRSDLVFLAVVGVLLVTGVLTAGEALSGFSSTSVAVVGVMFVASFFQIPPRGGHPCSWLCDSRY